MNRTVVLTGIVSFILGIGCGFWGAPKARSVHASQPMLKNFTSQGRAEIQKMIAEINVVMDEDIAGIMAEKTQMLQAITAKVPDRTAADFHLAGMEDKKNTAQTKVDKSLLDAIQRMPLIDRQTYMKLYMKNRSFLTLRSIVLPFVSGEALDDLSLSPLKTKQSSPPRHE